MKASALPTKVQLPFGGGPNASSYMRSVPVASQQGIINGAASFTDGFPPVCFQPIGSGGVPPAGPDFQYLFNLVTAWNQWQAAGGLVPYDSAFSTAIGGYPAGGAVLSSTTPGRVWISTADNNTTNPDGSSPANWLALMLASDVLSLIIGSGQVPIIVPNPTVYVATTGNDTTADGTSAKPFATPEAATKFAATRYAPGSGTVTVQIASGTYAAPAASLNTAGLSVVWMGNTSAPANVNIQGNGPAGGGNAVIGIVSGRLTLNGLTVSNTGGSTFNNNTLGASTGGNLTITNVILGSSGGNGASHLNAGTASSVVIGSGCSLGGGMGFAFNASPGGSIVQSGVVALLSSPVFTTFANAYGGGVIQVVSGVAGFSGSATGKRYYAGANGVINTNGSGTTYFPGSTAGSVDTGGQYL